MPGLGTAAAAAAARAAELGPAASSAARGKDDWLLWLLIDGFRCVCSVSQRRPPTHLHPPPTDRLPGVPLARRPQGGVQAGSAGGGQQVAAVGDCGTASATFDSLLQDAACCCLACLAGGTRVCRLDQTAFVCTVLKLAVAVVNRTRGVYSQLICYTMQRYSSARLSRSRFIRSQPNVVDSSQPITPQGSRRQSRRRQSRRLF